MVYMFVLLEKYRNPVCKWSLNITSDAVLLFINKKTAVRIYLGNIWGQAGHAKAYTLEVKELTFPRLWQEPWLFHNLWGPNRSGDKILGYSHALISSNEVP